MSESNVTRRRRFCLVLIKPSHYDDDGYVIQWYRSGMPANSLAILYGLARECAEQKILGDDVEIEIHAIDETNTRVRPEKIESLIKTAEAGGMVMMVGVQSNQFPRSLDIARSLRERDIQVAIGGFHVSGTLSMLKGIDLGLKKAQDLGVSLFAGEAEGRIGQVLKDAFYKNLQPLYNFMHDLPNIESVATPVLPSGRVKRTVGTTTSFDAGRGCPFTCSFCTIINVQGRKSRRRSPDDIERIIRENVKQGLSSFFITDDNFARNKDWEIILDRLIHLREVEKLNIRFTIQVDTLCHKLPNFIEKSKRAGVKRVFIGLENINPDSLLGAKKRQNKITDYRTMLLAWKKIGVLTCCGYILGFPGDTKESILRDVEVIKKELPIDLLEFFYLTPLPGSEDHQKLYKDGVDMDADLNKYDLHHITTDHPKMSFEEWTDACHSAWKTYYSREHAETILRRAVASGVDSAKILFYLVWFWGGVFIEDIHPLEGGIFRMKYRRDRRSGLPLESPFIFYPKFYVQLLWKQARWISLFTRMWLLCRKVERDPQKLEYMDLALEPVTDNEIETRELFQTEAAHNYLEKVQRLEKIRHGEMV